MALREILKTPINAAAARLWGVVGKPFAAAGLRPGFSAKNLKRAAVLAGAGALCFAGYFAASAAYDYATRPRPQFNVILCVGDALSPYHIGCYGYGRDTSPNIDRLAKEATVYLDHKSQSSMTTCSMSSIFTSRVLPIHHIPDDLVSLPEALKSAGYRTFGVQTNPWLDKERGFERGFDRYVRLWSGEDRRGVLEGGVKAHASAVFEEIRGEIEAAAGGAQPFFIYAHFMDTHSPYMPDERADVFSKTKMTAAEKKALSDAYCTAWYRGDYETARAMSEDARALYDGGVREMDEAIGGIVELLRAKGIYDRTMLIVTADHGEQFFEHDMTQHTGLYHSVVRIPLVMKMAGQGQGGAVGAPSRNIDLYPTILRAADFNERRIARYGLNGAPLQLDRPRRYARGIVTHLYEKKPNWYYVEDSATGFKLIAVKGAGESRMMLFNRWEDPDEKTDLAELMPREVERLTSQLPYFRMSAEQAAESRKEITPEQREQLKALGYLN